MNEALNMERGNSFKDTVLQETLKIMLKRPDSAVAINFSRRLACDDSIDLDGLAIPAMEQLAALESKARVPGCRKDAADVLYRWRSGVSSLPVFLRGAAVLFLKSVAMQQVQLL